MAKANKRQRFNPKCPMESVIGNALIAGDYEFLDGSQTPEGLDFYLVKEDVFIEVKQFYSERIHEQISRSKNVIVIQGVKAAKLFAEFLMFSVDKQAHEAAEAKLKQDF